jgi:filamentous hemagglutinin
LDGRKDNQWTKSTSTQVYIANINSFELKNGQILAKKDIDLEVKQIDNKGNIKSSQDIKILAQNDIRNISGTIQANNISLESSQGSIINETSVKHIKTGQASNNISFSSIGNQASIEATNGKLEIQAQKDIINKAGNLKSSESINLSTQEGNIELLAQKAQESQDTRDDKGFRKSQKTTHLQSNIQAGEEIVLNSAKAISIEATKLKTQDNITINAQEEINILASNNVDYQDTQTTQKKNFGRSKTHRDMTYSETVVGSSIEASNINLNSAKSSINLESVNFSADTNINAKAKENVNITAKQYKEGTLSYTKKKGFGGLSSSSSTNQIENLNLKESKLTITEDDINISEGINLEGENINIIASSIDAKNKNLNIKAQDELNLLSLEEIQKNKNKTEKQKFNLAGALGMVGSKTTLFELVDDENTKYTTKHKSSSLKANNITIDSGSTTIAASNIEAVNEVDIKADTGEINILSVDELDNSTTSNKSIKVSMNGIQDMVKSAVSQTKENSTKIKMEIASATYDAVDEQNENTNVLQSSIISKNANVKLDALSDINIVASNIQAQENIDLESEVGNVNIQESYDKTAQKKKEVHGEAKISVTVQNEYAEIVTAALALKDSKKQLSQTKEDYSNYKKDIKKQEQRLVELKEALKNKEIGIDRSDIEDLQEIISDLQSDESFYKTAIIAASLDVVSKTTALIQQTATAAQSSGTYGFSAGLSLDVEGSKTKTESSSQSAVASNLNASNIKIKTSKDINTKVDISGSSLEAEENIDISTKDLIVTSSQDTTNSTIDNKNINGSISISMYGGGGPSVNLGVGKSTQTSESIKHNNSNLKANNITLDVANDATFKGSSVTASNSLDVTIGNNLTVESVRDISKTRSKSSNVGISAGSSGVSGANAGFSKSNSTTKQTVLSSLTGNKVDIKVGNETALKASLIAAGQKDENGNFIDNNNLNLETKTLIVENLSNANYGKALGASAGRSGSNVSLGFNNSLRASKTKTLATIGQGNINITDKENSEELAYVNRDTKNNIKEIYSTSTGTSVDVTIDTRLFTKDGRKDIAEDLKISSKITDSIEKIAKSDNLGITDFFSETNFGVKKYEALKELMINEPGVFEKLQDKNTSRLEKENLENYIAQSIDNKLGKNIVDKVKVIATDEKGQGGKDVAGFITMDNNNIYSNIKNQKDLEGTLFTLGQEYAGLYQKSNGVDISTNRDNNNEYQNLVAKNTIDDIKFISSNNNLNVNLNTANPHYNKALENSTPSVFNPIASNNAEFKNLDKDSGDNFMSPEDFGAYANHGYNIVKSIASAQYIGMPIDKQEINKMLESSPYNINNINSPLITKKGLIKGVEIINKGAYPAGVVSAYTGNAPAAAFFGTVGLISDGFLYFTDKKTGQQITRDTVVDVMADSKNWKAQTAGVVLKETMNTYEKKKIVSPVKKEKNINVFMGVDINGNLIYNTFSIEEKK